MSPLTAPTVTVLPEEIARLTPEEKWALVRAFDANISTSIGYCGGGFANFDAEAVRAQAIERWNRENPLVPPAVIEVLRRLPPPPAPSMWPA